MSSYDALVSAYFANGGTVTRLKPGQSNGMTARDWSRAVRGELPNGEPSQEQLEEMRAEVYAEAKHAGGTAAVNELLAAGV